MERPPRSPPALPDELVEEVLARSPPDDPARLVRTALVCKRWCRLVSGAGFRRRFREFHRALAPMLGFLYSFQPISEFVRTAPSCPPLVDDREWLVVDARHGRLLLHKGPWDWNRNPFEKTFAVWDPVTGEREELPLLKRDMFPSSWNAAVLCAASSSATCDHSDCRGGAFLVVIVGTNFLEMFAHVYSSEAGAWREKIVVEHPESDFMIAANAVLARSALYFMFLNNRGILRYDLNTQDMSLIDTPIECSFRHRIIMRMDGGGLGLANIADYKLYLWSRDVLPNKDAEWTQIKVFDLKKLLPVCPGSESLELVGYGPGIIFMWVDEVMFTIQLKSSRVTEVSKEDNASSILPYMSFHTPALGAYADEEPRVRALGA